MSWRRLAVAAPIVVALLGVAASWALLFAVIPPGRQDFPLADDWSFARGAFRFARGEGVHYGGWPSMPLLGQWAWACPFVWAMGESHVALRFSTLGLAGFGLAALWDLLRAVPGVSGRVAAFAAAAVALNPYFYVLSGTFMNDVPALSLSLVALALLRRGAARGRWGPLCAGGTVAALAAVTRQNALAAPLAALALPVRRFRLPWLARCVATVGPVAAGLAAALWFNHRPDVNVKPITAPSARHIIEALFRCSPVLGLSVLPVLALCPRLVLRRRFLVGLVVSASAMMLWLHVNWLWDGQPYGRYMAPPLGNVLTTRGIYPILRGDPPNVLGRQALAALAAAGCLGLAAVIAGPGGVTPAPVRLGGAGRCLMAFSLAHLALMMLTRPFFDRYALVLLPGAMLRTLPRRSAGRPLWWAGLAALAVTGALAVGLMHDWLALNQARWELGRRAIARGIAATDIEGGLEWDGWNSPRAIPPAHRSLTDNQGLMLPFNHLLFPEMTGRHALSVSEIPATIPVDSEPYHLWLAPGPRRLLLVKQQPTGTTAKAAKLRSAPTHHGE